MPDLFEVAERDYLSEKVEEAKPNPETIHKIEERLHHIEEAAQVKLHDLGERLHLTSSPNKEDGEKERKREREKISDAETRRRADAEKEESKSVGG